MVPKKRSVSPPCGRRNAGDEIMEARLPTTWFASPDRSPVRPEKGWRGYQTRASDALLTSHLSSVGVHLSD